MKILYVLNSGRSGGMEQHVLDLVNGMRSFGHEVYVWCNDGEVVSWYKNAGANVSAKNIKYDIDPLYILNLSKFIKANKIDIVHAHELKACVNSAIASKISGVKAVITHIHTPMSLWTIEWHKKVIDFIKLLGYSILVKIFASKEIALTDFIKSVKISEGIPERKLVVIPNGLDLQNFNLSPDTQLQYRREIREKYQIPQEAFVYGVVGRISREKGHFVLLDAFNTLANRAPMINEPIYLLVAGGGVLEKDLIAKVAELKLESKVKITGIFDQNDKLKLYSSFDVFVFPSLAEGFGIVLIESMALGIPSVVSDLEVLQEVGGSTCFYFETKNSHDLADKMFDVFAKKDKLENIRTAERERVEKLYSLDKFYTNYQNLYLGLMENNK